MIIYVDTTGYAAMVLLPAMPRPVLGPDRAIVCGLDVWIGSAMHAAVIWVARLVWKGSPRRFSQQQLEGAA